MPPRASRGAVLQLLTNFGFAVLVGTGLFALGMPNALLWGLLAGAFRFVPYVGAILGALLPTLIALAVMPAGWAAPGARPHRRPRHPRRPGGRTPAVRRIDRRQPAGLILSAIFWAPVGADRLLLSTPLTICLLVLGTHVPNLRFLRVLLGTSRRWRRTSRSTAD